MLKRIQKIYAQKRHSQSGGGWSYKRRAPPPPPHVDVIRSVEPDNDRADLSVESDDHVMTPSTHQLLNGQDDLSVESGAGQNMAGEEVEEPKEDLENIISNLEKMGVYPESADQPELNPEPVDQSELNPEPVNQSELNPQSDDQSADLRCSPREGDPTDGVDHGEFTAPAVTTDLLDAIVSEMNELLDNDIFDRLISTDAATLPRCNKHHTKDDAKFPSLQDLVATGSLQAGDNSQPNGDISRQNSTRKKAVSFNDVVRELGRPVSLCSDSLPTMVTTVATIETPGGRYGATVWPAWTDASGGVTEPKRRLHVPDDDVLSIASEQDQYSNTEDEDEDDEAATRQARQTKIKVRRLLKLRSVNLVLAWFALVSDSRHSVILSL